MKRNEIMEYWIKSSEVDFQAMENLFNHGHYVWAFPESSSGQGLLVI